MQLRTESKSPGLRRFFGDVYFDSILTKSRRKLEEAKKRIQAVNKEKETKGAFENLETKYTAKPWALDNTVSRMG